MILLTPPPLVEVLRADTRNLETTVNSLLEHYNPADGGQFNYIRSVKTIRRAYQGYHNLPQLLAASPSIQERVGFKPNQDVIGLASPLAFGRSTHVFDLKGRRFSFGRERYASYRIPFFFTEAGVVKLYFLQYRKGFFLDKDIYGGMLTIHQDYLLSQEFYGEKCDVEYVDCAASEEKGPRVLRKYNSTDLERWSNDRLNDQVRMVAAAMDEIESRSLKVKRIRPLRDIELPLFD